MKNRQGLTIAALIIAIVGLSIGFAAFSNTLTISSSASVNPSDTNFIVQFSKYYDSDATGELNPITPNSATYGVNGLIPDSNKKSLTGLKATFTAPNQSVTYNLYVRNTGQYVAYLKELSFANATNATGNETYKHCYAKTENVPAAEQATPGLVSNACNGISISVTIGTASNITPESQSKSLGNQALAAVNGYVSASVTITYAENAAYVDGPMEVEFGTISFTASSNPAVQQQQEQSSPSSPSTPVASGSLIATSADLDGLDDTEGEYTIARDNSINTLVGYTDEYSVTIQVGQSSYFYAFSSSFFENEFGVTGLNTNTWYYTEDFENFSPYTGSSPISASTFANGTIYSQSYLEKVIASFSNSNS